MRIFPWLVISFLLSASNAIANEVGKNELTLSSNAASYFAKYIKKRGQNKPSLFLITKSGVYTYWTWCPYGMNNCSSNPLITEKCEKWLKKKFSVREECFIFAKGRRVVWDNGNDFSIKERILNSKWSEQKINEKLTQLGFLGSKKIINRKADDAAFEKETKKYREDFKKKMDKKNKLITKQSNNKIAKKYSLKGERPLALSWDGYSDLIAGKVKFNEADSKGSVNFVLPNNDGTCEGSYNLQQQGKGTWQISCTNNMGAAGTINWVKNGSVTGTGRDYKDKKVKFTISQ